MTVREQEHLHQTRLRSLAKARAARKRNAARARCEEDRARKRFAQWVRREHEAFDAYVSSGRAPRELKAWQRVLRDMPALYGARAA